MLDSHQLCNTIFTSGSSGTPKAMLHCVANHLASARGSASLIPVDQNSGWLLSLPLFHIGGYAIPFRVFLAGGRVILDEAPSHWQSVLSSRRLAICPWCLPSFGGC